MAALNAVDGLDVRQTELSSQFVFGHQGQAWRQGDGSWVKCVPLPWLDEGTEDRGVIPHIPHIFSKVAVL